MEVAVTVTVEEAIPEADAIVITGPQKTSIPGSGSTTHNYEATVYDQFQAVMADEEVTWSLAEEVTGVSIDENTAEVTVTSATEAGNFTVVATSQSNGNVSGELTVTLTEVTVSKLDSDYYAAGDTLEFTISGLKS